MNTINPAFPKRVVCIHCGEPLKVEYRETGFTVHGHDCADGEQS